MRSCVELYKRYTQQSFDLSTTTNKQTNKQTTRTSLMIGRVVLFMLLAVVVLCAAKPRSVKINNCGVYNCKVGQLCCGNVQPVQHKICYDPNTYSCIPSQRSTKNLFGTVNCDCVKGFGCCTSECFDQDIYNCVNGALVQKPLANPLQATLKCGKSKCTPPQRCFTDGGTLFRCYSPFKQSERPDDSVFGGRKLCSILEASCGLVCYDPTIYYCNGGIVTMRQPPPQHW
jgi:hypothetical protein